MKKTFFFSFFSAMKQTSRRHFDSPLVSSQEREKKNIREAITAKTVSLRLPSINYSSATTSPHNNPPPLLPRSLGIDPCVNTLKQAALTQIAQTTPSL